MAKMKKKLIIHVIIGFVVGAAMGMLIAWLGSFLNGEKLMENTWITTKVGRGGAIALQVVVGGLLGCACVTGMVLYEIEKWSLALATVVHFLVIMVSFTIASFSMGWFAGSIKYFFIAIGCNAVGFAIIWVIMYLLWKREVKRMNEELKEYKNAADRNDVPKNEDKDLSDK